MSPTAVVACPKCLGTGKADEELRVGFHARIPDCTRCGGAGLVRVEYKAKSLRKWEHGEDDDS